MKMTCDLPVACLLILTTINLGRLLHSMSSRQPRTAQQALAAALAASAVAKELGELFPPAAAAAGIVYLIFNTIKVVSQASYMFVYLTKLFVACANKSN